MESIEMGIKSEDLVRRCLRVSPPKFNGFIISLTTIVRFTPLTFEELNSMIMEEKMWWKVCNSTNEAYVSNENGRGKAKDLGESFDMKMNIKFFYCGEMGHIVKECHKKQADAKNDTL